MSSPPDQLQSLEWLDDPAATSDQDTAAVDTLFEVPAIGDTADSPIEYFERSIEEAGSQLMAGEWELFWTTFYERGANLLIEFIPNLIGAILVFIILYTSYRLLDRVLLQLLRRSPRVNKGLQNLLLKTFRSAALIFIGVMVLDQFGLNVTALLAGLSIAGLAIGFAARDTLENFIAGITILLDRPFQVGHRIEISDTYGKVEEITLRSTRLRTPQDEIMVLPNSIMINEKLVNHSFLGSVRVDVPFGIAYKESPSRAREIALGLLEGDDRIDVSREPSVIVTELGDSSVDMALLFYIKQPDQELRLRFEYTERVFTALREAGIEIPFPHLQLTIDEAKAFENSFLMQPELPRTTPDNSRPEAKA